MLGWFWTSFGVGALLGSFAFGMSKPRHALATGRAIIVGWGAMLGVLSLTNGPIGIAVFATCGAVWAPYPILVTTNLQRQATGRDLTALSASWTSATILATPLGTALGGPLVAWAGASGTLRISAVATLAIVPVATLVRRSGRNRTRASRPST